MRISEIKGEKALDVFADILEPFSVIFQDEEVSALFSDDKKLKAVSVAVKRYKKEVIAILATLDGEDPETYQPGVFTIPLRFIEIMTDEGIKDLFISLSQNAEAFSGSATENTGASEN